MKRKMRKNNLDNFEKNGKKENNGKEEKKRIKKRKLSN